MCCLVVTVGLSMVPPVGGQEVGDDEDRPQPAADTPTAQLDCQRGANTLDSCWHTWTIPPSGPPYPTTEPGRRGNLQAGNYPPGFVTGISSFAELARESSEKPCPFSSFKFVDTARSRADVVRKRSQGEREVSDCSRLDA